MSMIEQLYLIARIGDQRAAFRSAEVESVVVIRNVTPVPAAPAHITGLLALRSRVITLVDARIAVGKLSPVSAEGCKAIIYEMDGHSYGIVVDQVEDVVFIDQQERPVRGHLDAGWGQVSETMIDWDNDTLLVIDTAKMVQGPQRSKVA